LDRYRDFVFFLSICYTFIVMTKLKRFFIFILAVAIIFSGTSGVAQAAAKTKTSAKYNFIRIFYYQQSKVAKTSFFNHYSAVDVLAPQVYSLTATGTLEGSLDSEVLAFAKKKKIKVMPLVVNKKFSRAGAEAFLSDPSARVKAEQAMVEEAKENGYWGWQVDLESIDASYRDQFSSFIAELYKVMKANKLTLSVAIMAEHSSDPADYPEGSWQKYVGVFDYDALAPNADFFSIMTYDDPWSTGPIARYSWIKKVLDYAVKHIPSKKISLGLPLYYWQWDNASSQRIGIGGYVGLKNVLDKYYTKYYYDTVYQAPYVTYKKNKKAYTIWYENGRSLTAKIDLLKQYGLGGYSAWSLGLEVPSTYTAFTKLSY
jgi:spore germination protein YaaH